MNPKVNEECERRMKDDEEASEARWKIESYYRERQEIIDAECESKRKAELMEQCLQKAKKNIEFEKRKQSHSNKKETSEEYTARKELQAQRAVKKETPEEYKARIEYKAQKENKAVKKETPEEYKARIERHPQKIVKKETPEEYKARKDMQAQKAVKK
jgi:arylsulfatase A-like enzyme